MISKALSFCARKKLQVQEIIIILFFFCHLDSLNVMMKSLRSSITINQCRLSILAVGILFSNPIGEATDLSYHGDGMASSVGNCSVKARKWYFLFSAYDSFFIKSNVYHNLICVPADNKIKWAMPSSSSSSCLNH